MRVPARGVGVCAAENCEKPKTSDSFLCAEHDAAVKAWRDKHPEALARAEVAVKQPVPRTSFPRATYLGGMSNVKRKHTGNLIFQAERAGIGVVQPKTMWLTVSMIASIEVYGAEVAKSKVAPAIAFGVLGAVTAKGRKDQTVIVFHMTTGEIAYFQLDKVPAVQVRAGLSGWMRVTGVRYKEDLPTVVAPVASAVTPPSPSEEISRLAELHRAGALTDEEFTAAKAKLLGL